MSDRLSIRILFLCFLFALYAAGDAKALSVQSRFGKTDAVTKLDIKEVIIKKAKQKLRERYNRKNPRINLRPRWIPNNLLQKDPHDIISVELAGKIHQYTNFDVTYKVQNQEKVRQVQFFLEIKVKVPVATQRLQKGQKVKDKNFEHQWISLLKYKDDLVKTEEDLIDKTIRRTVLAGQPVRQSDISTEYIIEAGDQVTLIIRRSGIQVEVSGEARENGAKGEDIKIFSEETRRKYLGKVIKSGVILWKKTL